MIDVQVHMLFGAATWEAIESFFHLLIYSNRAPALGLMYRLERC